MTIGQRPDTQKARLSAGPLSSPAPFERPFCSGFCSFLKRHFFSSWGPGPLLKRENPVPDFLPPGALEAWGGRRRMSDALLVPMLLIGGCGYEDLRLCSLVAIERRL